MVVNVRAPRACSPPWGAAYEDFCTAKHLERKPLDEEALHVFAVYKATMVSQQVDVFTSMKWKPEKDLTVFSASGVKDTDGACAWTRGSVCVACGRAGGADPVLLQPRTRCTCF